MDPRTYYDGFGRGEWERLEANPVARLEFEGTVACLDDELPAAGRVLDAGGGPGRYARWLADRGHEVAHLDVSAEQTRIARERTAESGGVAVHQGDVRALPFADGAFDAVCCLGGALGHVLDAAERERAARELGRVATPGAPVVVSVIGRLAAVRYGMKHGGHPGVFTEILETGDYTQALLDEHDAGEGWAECHFYRADELEAELAAAGLTVRRLLGLEGPATHLGDELADADEATLDGVREVVATLREDPAVVDTAEHVLAVCRA